MKFIKRVPAIASIMTRRHLILACQKIVEVVARHYLHVDDAVVGGQDVLFTIDLPV